MSEQKLYKVLRASGMSFHGGDMQWSLPVKRGRGYQPGAWHEVEGEIEACLNGLHLTTEPYNWYEFGAAVYEAQGEGDSDTDDDKTAFRRARLLRPVPQPAWITKAQDFIASIPSVKWLQPDGLPSADWQLFPTWNAARDAARNAAWNAAWDAAWDAARNAAWNAAGNAARDAAGNAAWDAARDAAWDAAWDAARDAAGNAAWDARLYVTAECVCEDLDLCQQHRDHTRARWQVWAKGYGLLCDVNGVLYVYEKVA